MVVGSRPQVGSSILIAPRRRLATAAFDQAVNVFLFIDHEHTNIVKPVGSVACCVADAGGISGSFHPTAPMPHYFRPSPTLECSNMGTWSMLLESNDPMSSPGVAVALVWRSLQRCV